MQLPRPTLTHLRGLAIAAVIANIGIVVTGGAVRLTGSGLGCPTWPRCTEESFVAHQELGINGAIEFSNRMLTFVVGIVVALCWLAAMRYQPRRRDLRWLSGILVLGVPAQAVMGGLTVLTHLDPWVVGLHFMVSPVLVVVAVVFARHTRETGGPATRTVPAPVRGLAIGTLATTFVVMYVGTIVTGSGPHAGDLTARRNGIDPETISQFHADVVFLLVGLTIGVLVAFRATSAPARAQRAALALLLTEIGQGLVGFVQYFTGLPAVLVGIHLAGATLTVAAATWLVLGTRRLNAPAGTTDVENSAEAEEDAAGRPDRFGSPTQPARQPG